MTKFNDGYYNIVIVYGPETPDWQKAIDNAPLKSPNKVRSFFDDPGNIELSLLSKAIENADVVILPVGRVAIEGSSVSLVVPEMLADPQEDRDVLYFDDNYEMYEEPVGQPVTPFLNWPREVNQESKET